MPARIIVNLTDRECDALVELSQELDLPQDRVLVQALRHYRSALHPVEQIPMMSGCPHATEHGDSGVGEPGSWHR